MNNLLDIQIGELCRIADPREDIPDAPKTPHGDPIHGFDGSVCVGDVLLVVGYEETQSGVIYELLKNGKRERAHSFWCEVLSEQTS